MSTVKNRYKVEPREVNARANDVFIRAMRINEALIKMEEAGLRNHKDPIYAASYNSMLGERNLLNKELERLLRPQIKIVLDHRAAKRKVLARGGNKS